MPYVPVPKDMSKVKVKVLFGLTKRQIVCFGSGAVIGIPLYFLIRGHIPGEIAMAIMIVVMAPFFFVGMYERGGLPAEKILKNRLWTMLCPSTRPYKQKNLFEYLEEREVTEVGKSGKNAAKGSGAGRGESAAKNRGGKR